MALPLSELLSVIGTTFLFAGLIIASIQLALLRRQLNMMATQVTEQNGWSKKEATFAYVAKFRNELRGPNLALHRRLRLLIHDGTAGDPATIDTLLHNDAMRLHLFEMVFYFEHLSIGIGEGYFDEQIARAFLSNVTTSTYAALLPYILRRRKETGRHIGGHFEKLATLWKRLEVEGGGPSETQGWAR